MTDKLGGPPEEEDPRVIHLLARSEDEVRQLLVLWQGATDHTSSAMLRVGIVGTLTEVRTKGADLIIGGHKVWRVRSDGHGDVELAELATREVQA